MVSLREISLHFETDESAIEKMMERWVDKGQIVCIEMNSGSCGQCCSCGPGIRKHYEWKGALN